MYWLSSERYLKNKKSKKAPQITNHQKSINSLLRWVLMVLGEMPINNTSSCRYYVGLTPL